MTQTFSKKLYRSSRVILLAFVAIMIIGGSGCKSKKKAAEAADAAAEKARIEQEARERQQAAAEEEKRAEEERLAAEKGERKASANKLETYFEAITNASSINSANETINEALTLFASPDIPVLIVISEYNGQKDYDRPTTIKEYLNYLKDQKKNLNSIGDLQFDSSGQITQVELIKK